MPVSRFHGMPDHPQNSGMMSVIKIVQKVECFVECTKPPVVRKAKPGGINSVCNIFDENKKSEPIPDWE